MSHVITDYTDFELSANIYNMFRVPSSWGCLVLLDIYTNNKYPMPWEIQNVQDGNFMP